MKEEGETEKAVLREFKGGEAVGRGKWSMVHSIYMQQADVRVVVSGGMDVAFQLVRGVNGSFCEHEERGQR